MTEEIKTAWYVLRVKPHKEPVIAERLREKGAEVYLPMVQVNPVNKRAAKKKPYFPGYVFLKIDLEAFGVNTINWMPGTIGLVSFGGIQATIPENLILEIKQNIAKIEEAGGLTFVDLQPGDRVRIVEGPFAGYEAIFDMRLKGKDRVQVLLAFLSQYPQTVELDEKFIQKKKK